MQRRKKTSKITAKIKKTTIKAVKSSKEEYLSTKQSITQNLFEQLKLGESYVSLVLGAVVVFAIFIIIFIFIRQGNLKNNSLPVSKSIKTTITPKYRTYILQEGEGLWDVAVKFYGDGYRYTDIIQANNLPDPDNVEPGTRLVIPNLK